MIRQGLVIELARVVAWLDHLRATEKVLAPNGIVRELYPTDEMMQVFDDITRATCAMVNLSRDIDRLDGVEWE